MSTRSITALDSNLGERSESSSVESMTTSSTQELRDELQAIEKLTDEKEYTDALAAFFDKLTNKVSDDDTAYSSIFDSISESIKNIPFESRANLLKQYDAAMTLSTDGDSVETGIEENANLPVKTHLLTIHELDSTKTGLVSDIVAASYLYSDDMPNKFDIKLQNIDDAKQSLEKNVVEALEISNGNISRGGGKRSKRKSSKRKSSKRKSSKRGKKGKRSTKHKRRR